VIAAVEHSIHVIGIDESGPAGLTASELRLVESAELLCGGPRHLALFPNGCSQRFTITADLDALYERLAGSDSTRVVILASGDPCFYGIGPLLVERFGRERVDIHPRASSVALAFARLGIAWQDATVVSVHGRPIEEAIPPALSSTKLAILTDPQHTPSAVASALIAAGMEDCPAFVCERLGGPEERVHKLSISSLLDREFDPVNVLILLPGGTGGGVQDPTLPSLGEAASRGGFGRADADYVAVRGQVTKAEVRAVTISRLEPWRAAVCWDVGAGSGSVAIESAWLMPAPAVYAVERDPEQIAALRQNLRAHHGTGVHLVEGSAPEALETLPAPDAVFVGGGGRSLLPILQLAAQRLRPGGRLVADFALLESLSTWQTFAASSGWRHDCSQIAVARAEPLADGHRLAPLSPVFVTRLVKPDAVS
jgi:precorrin-6B C5,15-methyltransferase / cobalt-precorrin-6B C5,C15-methyltransferase